MMRETVGGSEGHRKGHRPCNIRRTLPSIGWRTPRCNKTRTQNTGQFQYDTTMHLCALLMLMLLWVYTLTARGHFNSTHRSVQQGLSRLSL